MDDVGRDVRGAGGRELKLVEVGVQAVAGAAVCVRAGGDEPAAAQPVRASTMTAAASGRGTRTAGRGYDSRRGGLAGPLPWVLALCSAPRPAGSELAPQGSGTTSRKDGHM